MCDRHRDQDDDPDEPRCEVCGRAAVDRCEYCGAAYCGSHGREGFCHACVEESEWNPAVWRAIRHSADMADRRYHEWAEAGGR